MAWLALERPRYIQGLEHLGLGRGSIGVGRARLLGRGAERLDALLDRLEALGLGRAADTAKRHLGLDDPRLWQVPEGEDVVGDQVAVVLERGADFSLGQGDPGIGLGDARRVLAPLREVVREQRDVLLRALDGS